MSAPPAPRPGWAATRPSAATPRRTRRCVARFAISVPARCPGDAVSNTGRMDLPPLPRRLRAPEPGWAEPTDVVVVGSGVAGLTAALHLRAAGLHVTVVTKVNIDDGSTRWAQGGIAAVLDPLDTPAAHARDTLVAGVGLGDPAAVDVLVTEGPARVRELMRWGADFDRYPDGTLMLTREGGHTPTGSSTPAGTPPERRCNGRCTRRYGGTRGSASSSTRSSSTCSVTGPAGPAG